MASNGENKGNSLQILIWLFFIFTLLTLSARFGTKYIVARAFRRDDMWISLGELVFLFQTISISIAASNGLGSPLEKLSVESVNRVLQAQYASIPLFLLCLALVQASLSDFIHQLSPNQTHRCINLVIRTFSGVWVVSATLVSLFQCALPTPWDYIHGAYCVDLSALWTYVVIGNIVSELGFVFLYVLIFWNIQVSWTVRAVILAAFSTRLLVVAADIAQLVIYKSTYSKYDPTFSRWLPILLMQVISVVSIITACFPYLKPFLESIDLDIVQVEVLDSLDEGQAAQDRDVSGIMVLTEITSSSVDCQSSNR